MTFLSLIIYGISDPVLWILSESSTESYSASFESSFLWIISAASCCLQVAENLIIYFLERPSEIKISSWNLLFDVI